VPVPVGSVEIVSLDANTSGEDRKITGCWPTGLMDRVDELLSELKFGECKEALDWYAELDFESRVSDTRRTFG
jgi:hypothetical protein